MAASGQFVVTLTEDVQRNGGHALQLVALPPFQSPPRPVLFTGREAEIQRIKSLLGLAATFAVDSRCLFCLEGKGGVGKISLGIHLAYLLQPHFPNSFLRAGWGRAHPIAVMCPFAAAYRHDVTRYADLESRSSKVRELPAGKFVRTLRLPTEAIVGLGELTNSHAPGEQWLGVQRWKKRLLEQVETALEASGADQAVLIASMREQIRNLRDRITELEQEPSLSSFSLATEPEAVKVSKPAINDLTAELTKHETKKYETRPLSKIRNLIIHHSAAPASVGPRRIAAYHVKKQDWPGIGYHFLVGEDGTL